MFRSARYLANAEKCQQYADAAYTGAASYAEFGEDLILMSALNTVDRGFYIDVGAWDEAKHSVTKLFYTRGRIFEFNSTKVPGLAQTSVDTHAPRGPGGQKNNFFRAARASRVSMQHQTRASLTIAKNY